MGKYCIVGIFNGEQLIATVSNNKLFRNRFCWIPRNEGDFTFKKLTNCAPSN